MRWWFLALAACSGGSSISTSSSPPSSTPVAPAASLVGAPAEDPGGAEPWRYRTLHTGLIEREAELVRYTLRWQGPQATLVIERQRMEGSDADVARGRWLPAGSETWRGRVQQRGGSLELELAGPSAPEVLRCTRILLEVAAARAVRISDPAFDQECGNQGVWSPATTSRVDVLRCQRADDTTLEFARGGGLELLSVNDDCVMQGSGLRAVAPSGAVAPARPPGEARD